MRVEDISPDKLKQAKDNELYSLKLRILQIWQKVVDAKDAVKKRAFREV